MLSKPLSIGSLAEHLTKKHEDGRPIVGQRAHVSYQSYQSSDNLHETSSQRLNKPLHFLVLFLPRQLCSLLSPHWNDLKLWHPSKYLTPQWEEMIDSHKQKNVDHSYFLLLRFKPSPLTWMNLITKLCRVPSDAETNIYPCVMTLKKPLQCFHTYISSDIPSLLHNNHSLINIYQLRLNRIWSCAQSSWNRSRTGNWWCDWHRNGTDFRRISHHLILLQKFNEDIKTPFILLKAKNRKKQRPFL